MRPVLLILALAMSLLTACRALPPLRPLADADAGQARCDIPFVKQKMQFVHAISATMPGGRQSLVTGVTSVYPGQQSVHAALLTQEGMVLFEGEYRNGRTQILRSVPPFSNGGFAEGMMTDVRLTFLPPPVRPMVSGVNDRNELVCRYRDKPDMFLDVEIDDQGGWRLNQYDSDASLVKQIVAYPGDPFPARIVLTATGVLGYQLDMKLIQQSTIP